MVFSPLPSPVAGSGALPFRVLPDDSPQNWGALLLRLLPRKDLEKGSHALMMLRVLAANPEAAGSAPPLVEPKDPNEGRLGAIKSVLVDTVSNRTGAPHVSTCGLWSGATAA